LDTRLPSGALRVRSIVSQIHVKAHLSILARRVQMG
jgi:hypothetical protein